MAASKFQFDVSALPHFRAAGGWQSADPQDRQDVDHAVLAENARMHRARRVIVAMPERYDHKWWKRLPVVDRWLARRYAHRCMQHSRWKGESPISQDFTFRFSGIFRDACPIENADRADALGSWLLAADTLVLYIDRGMNTSMELLRHQAVSAGVRVEHRTLGSGWINFGRLYAS